MHGGGFELPGKVGGARLGHRGDEAVAKGVRNSHELPQPESPATRVGEDHGATRRESVNVGDVQASPLDELLATRVRALEQ